LVDRYFYSLTIFYSRVDSNLLGPLSGAFLQPIFGALSDNCDHPWGKRKPFILCGASCVVLCILALACTEDLTGDHVGKGFRPPVAYGVKIEARSHLLTQLLAIFWVCAINIAIQPFQSGVRALIVDNCPPEQQVHATAWSTRWNGLGSVFIGLVGFSNTTKWAPFLGKTQFKALGVIATCSIAATVFLVCFFMDDEANIKQKKSFTSIRDLIMSPIESLRESMDDLPPTTRQVCKIQFAAWLGWFPILYYSSTYIYQTCKSPIEIYSYKDVLTIQVVISNHVHLGSREDGPEEIGQSDYRLIEVARESGSLAVFLFALVAFITSIVLPLLSRQVAEKSIEISTSATTILGMTLPQVWRKSFIILSFSMFLTMFSWTVPVSIGIIAIAGTSWAVTIWIPFALISAEIAQDTQQRIPETNDLEGKSAALRRYGGRDQTAAILGLHNMAISVPQIISALFCAFLFRSFEVIGVKDGAAWVFRFAGLAAGYAAYLTRHLEG
jgi:solute carrier family 45 protein 1/2/4